MNEWMNEWINEWMNEWMNEILHSACIQLEAAKSAEHSKEEDKIIVL